MWLGKREENNFKLNLVLLCFDTPPHPPPKKRGEKRESVSELFKHKELNERDVVLPFLFHMMVVQDTKQTKRNQFLPKHQ